jgi:hypothetical protein
MILQDFDGKTQYIRTADVHSAEQDTTPRPIPGMRRWWWPFRERQYAAPIIRLLNADGEELAYVPDNANNHTQLRMAFEYLDQIDNKKPHRAIM